ncbi:general substrate transporter [Hesseltinella vesiculosa]|uniref:General substrate transporter n=1 Tax=Hesseltinella vesiculosa TaxID=101127 RepID=A0A1X2G2U2_9FUNG|nr:general substrate transporter [Hesseltinella vesiculosa]
MPLKGKSLFRASTALAGCGFLLFGYDQGVMSGVVASKLFLNTMGNPNSATVGLIVAIYEIGCMFGALSTGYIGDKLGRRKTIRYGCLILIIGAILQTAAVDLGMMIFARILTGVGNGMNTATIPVYQAELSPPKSRGAHVAFEASLLTVGVGIAYWLEFGLYFVDSEVSWRFPLAFQIVFAMILGLASFILPETPRWLQAHGYEHESKTIIARLWTDEDTTHPRCVAEWEEIKEGIELERRTGVNTYRELFSKGKFNNRYRVLLGMCGQLIQQFGGINAISYYLTDVFMNAGMTQSMAMMMAGVDSIVYFIGSVTTIYTVERFGRRFLMYAGLIGQMVTLLITGISQWAFTQGHHGASAGVIVGVFLYNFAFGAAWLGLAWLYPSEIFSTGMRAKGNSMSTAANWIGNFVVAEITPVLFEYAGYWTFLMYAILNALFLIPIYFWYPETKGKSLEEIEVMFADEDVQADARSVCTGIGGTSLYDSKHDAESLRQRPPSQRFPSSGVVPTLKEKPAVDTEAAKIKQDYSEDAPAGPNFK